MNNSFDKNWEKIYEERNQLNEYPFQDFISFYHKTFSRKKNNKVLEIGCGYGNNLEFVSTFDHEIYGIDASKTVINLLIDKFKRKKVTCNLKVMDFTKLDFEKNYFDFILNREAVTCTSLENAHLCVKECYRTLKKGGLFYSTFLSNMNTFSGTINKEISKNFKGNFETVKQIKFYNILELQELFIGNNFEIKELYLNSKTDYIKQPIDNISYWSIIVKK